VTCSGFLGGVFASTEAPFGGIQNDDDVVKKAQAEAT
jgi:hypothetical protein